MVSANGITPWHKEGHVIPGEVSFKEGWKLSGHDFKVEKFQLHTPEGEAVPNAWGTRRTDNGHILTGCRRVLSDDWQPYQNADAWEVFEPLVKGGHVKLETAGVLDGGRKVWILGALVNHQALEVRKGDEVRNYVLFANGHDGSLSLTIGNTTVRVVCQNTLSAATHEGSMYKFRHIKGMNEKVEKWANIVAGLGQAFEKDIELFRQLDSTKVRGTKDIVNYTAAVFGKAEREQQKKDKISRRLQSMLDAFENEQAGSRAETHWDLYNALTYHVSHNSYDNLDSLAFGNRQKTLQRGLDVATVMSKGIPIEDVFGPGSQMVEKVQEISWANA